MKIKYTITNEIMKAKIVARPKKQRIIKNRFQTITFKPINISDRSLEEVRIGFDELEALRLTNLEHMSQEETARNMGISRQLVGLLLSNARKKITEALCFGKAIKIGEESK